MAKTAKEAKSKSSKTTSAKTSNPAVATEEQPVGKVQEYQPTELVIKEIMIQKGVSRDEAIHILKNPA